MFVLVAAAFLLSGAPAAQTTAADLLASRVDALFAGYDRQDSPGCVVGIYRDGQIVYSRGYGMQRQRFEDETLEPLFADAFTDGALLFRFSLGETGAVTGFSITMPGARGLRFDKATR